MTFEAGDSWVVYSPSASAIGDSAGFRSCAFGQATRFSTEETGRPQLPISTGGDARLVPWLNAGRHYG